MCRRCCHRCRRWLNIYVYISICLKSQAYSLVSCTCFPYSFSLSRLFFLVYHTHCRMWVSIEMHTPIGPRTHKRTLDDIYGIVYGTPTIKLIKIQALCDCDFVLFCFVWQCEYTHKIKSLVFLLLLSSIPICFNIYLGSRKFQNIINTTTKVMPKAKMNIQRRIKQMKIVSIQVISICVF